MYRRVLGWCERWTLRVDLLLGRWIPQEFNPLYYTGGMANIFLIAVFISGLLLFIYYVPTLDEAYGSVEYLTHEVPYGGVARSLHRYAADAMMVAAVLHLFRNWFTDRYRTYRDLAWLSGMALLVLTVFLGVTGYLLVWDDRAVLLTRITSLVLVRLDQVPGLGALGLGSHLARSFLGGAEISEMTLPHVLFWHLTPSMGLFVFLWMHYRRIARPKLWPPAFVTTLCVGLLLVLAGVLPAQSGAPGSAEVVPTTLMVDWLYLGWVWFLKHLPVWVVVTGGTVIVLGLTFVPYYIRDRYVAPGDTQAPP